MPIPPGSVETSGKFRYVVDLLVSVLVHSGPACEGADVDDGRKPAQLVQGKVRPGKGKAAARFKAFKHAVQRLDEVVEPGKIQPWRTRLRGFAYGDFGGKQVEISRFTAILLNPIRFRHALLSCRHGSRDPTAT